MCVFNFQLSIYVLLFQCILWHQFEFTNAVYGKTIPEDVKEGLFPFVVALTSSSLTPIGRTRFCGGALIAPQYVLTAAHCLRPCSKESVEVVVGSVNLDAGSTYKVQSWTTFDVWAKEKKKKGYMRNDIAIIKLTERVDEKFVGKWSRSPSNSYRGTDVIAVGWGQTNICRYPKLLKIGYLHVMTLDEVKKLWLVPHTTNLFVTKGKSLGFRTNRGDSGGPLLKKLGENAYEIIGVISGHFPSWCKECSLKVHNFHIALEPYIEFIEDILKS